MITAGHIIGWSGTPGNMVPRAAIWLTRDAVPEGQHWLHPAEQQRYAQLRWPARRQEFLQTRQAAKQALAQLGLSMPPAQIHIQAGCFGQPLIAEPGVAAAYGVGLSHTGGGWVAAVAFHNALPLGLDVEMLGTRAARALATRLTPLEQQLVATYPGWGYEALWTCKEALAKFLRTGLASPFALFEITALHQIDGYFEATFYLFPQLRAVLFRLEGAVLALVVPGSNQLAGCRLEFATLAHQLTNSAAKLPVSSCCTE